MCVRGIERRRVQGRWLDEALMVVCGVVGIGTWKLGVGSATRSRFETSVDRESARKYFNGAVE